MDDQGPRLGDSRSLWNFTTSPGWSHEEVMVLKLCLEKYGVGRWVQIVDSGALPGKLIQQLNGQTQRLLGQQSIAAFTGLHVDVDAVRRDNEAKQGPEFVRKGGLLINSGGALHFERANGKWAHGRCAPRARQASQTRPPRSRCGEITRPSACPCASLRLHGAFSREAQIRAVAGEDRRNRAPRTAEAHRRCAGATGQGWLARKGEGERRRARLRCNAHLQSHDELHRRAQPRAALHASREAGCAREPPASRGCSAASCS